MASRAARTLRAGPQAVGTHLITRPITGRALRLRLAKPQRWETLYRLHDRSPKPGRDSQQRQHHEHTQPPPIATHLLRSLSMGERRQSPRTLPQERFRQALHPPAAEILFLLGEVEEGPRDASSRKLAENARTDFAPLGARTGRRRTGSPHGAARGDNLEDRGGPRRGTLVHNLGGGARLRESAGLIELLGDPRDGALEQLVRVAKQRFGTRSITLAGPRKVRKRLLKIVAEHRLEIAQERER